MKNLTNLITFDTDHVKYEACRVVAMLARERMYHCWLNARFGLIYLLADRIGLLVEANSLPALSNLISSKFDVLKLEGALAISHVAEQEKFAPILADLPGLVEALVTTITTSSPEDAPDSERVKPETKKAAIYALLQLASRVPDLSKHVSIATLKAYLESTPNNADDDPFFGRKADLLALIQALENSQRLLGEKGESQNS